MDAVQTPTTRLMDEHARCLVRIAELEAALLRARQQIVDQQSLPDDPTWIDDVLKNQK